MQNFFVCDIVNGSNKLECYEFTSNCYVLYLSLWGCIHNFFFVTYEWAKQARVFEPGKLLQPCVML